MRAVMYDRVQEQVDELSSISLGDLNETAALQRRVDRKYIVSDNQLAALVESLSTRLAALDIAGRRSFAYESVYFDTPSFDAYLSSAYRRRNRFKVRTRSYLDSGVSMLEVKTRGVRKVTVKDRQVCDFHHRSVLLASQFGWVDSQTGRPGIAAKLSPVLATSYRRCTLVDLDDIARLTIDAGLRCVDWMGDEVGLHGSYVLETKSAGPPSTADRWLWSSGIRPIKISKFGTGIAALHPELPSNKWRRTIDTHFLPPTALS